MTQSLIQHEETSLPLIEHPPANRPKQIERLRILHVIPQLRPGGTEYTLLRLICGLGDEAFEHRICATRGMDADFAASQGVAGQVVTIGSLPWGARSGSFDIGVASKLFPPRGTPESPSPSTANMVTNWIR